MDAAKFLPAIDDDEVEVYGRAPDKINGYGAGAFWVYGIGGTHVNKRHDQPVQTLGPFTVAGALAVTDNASDGGVRPGGSCPPGVIVPVKVAPNAPLTLLSVQSSELALACSSKKYTRAPAICED